MIGQSGQDHARASLSARQAQEQGLLTSGTYGRTGTTSSRSANLVLCLESKLKTLATGSILYRLTWKHKVTPSGRRFCLLRASAARISDPEITGWPTPATKAKAGGEYSDPEKAIARALGPHANDLRDFVQMAGWATASSRDWKDTPGMATEATNPDGSARTRLDQLPRQVALAGWTTPQAHDTQGRSKTQKAIHGTKHGCACLALDADLTHWTTDDGPARLCSDGTLLTGFSAGMESGGRLDPAHPRWLMRLPPEWDACAPLTRNRPRA